MTGVADSEARATTRHTSPDSHLCSKEQDHFLPIANISRNMKRFLPGHAKIAKDAKEAVQECVSEFISFITSECVHGRGRVCGPVQAGGVALAGPPGRAL